MARNRKGPGKISTGKNATLTWRHGHELPMAVILKPRLAQSSQKASLGGAVHCPYD